jgi:hypothetical protein
MTDELREQKRRFDEAHDGSKWKVACSSDGTAYIYDEGAEIVATYLTPDAAEAICDAHNAWPALSAVLDMAVVPPCKVGSKVYAWSSFGNCVAEYEVSDMFISAIATQIRAVWMSYSECNEEIDFTPDDFGKTVFLTRAQAEAAMEVKNGN